jgi:hypothetical protein
MKKINTLLYISAYFAKEEDMENLIPFSYLYLFFSRGRRIISISDEHLINICPFGYNDFKDLMIHFC